MNSNQGFDYETSEEIINCIKVNQTNLKEANAAIRKMSKRKKLSFSKVMQFVRILLSGKSEGLPVKDMIELLGSEEALIRLCHGLESLNK